MHFIQIKTNSDKNIDSILSESILKVLNSNNFKLTNDSTLDLIDLIEDYIIELSEEDPIHYINSYFASINKSNDPKQYYDILAIDRSNNKYHLLLVNNYLNIPCMIEQLSDTDRLNKFNLIASSLSQYYNNSIALFGDAFIVSIDSSYYDILEKDGEEKDKQISSYKTIYYSFKYIDLFRSIADIYYINIYVQPLNQTVVYSRGILNNYIQSIKPNQITDNIIQIDHNNLKLYIKIMDILPNSHNHILLKINNESNNYYLTNILSNDIEILLKII
jgi:hypothetical protein